MLARIRGADREDGQVPIAIVVVVFLGLVMAIFRFALPLGQAADQKQTSQGAADAAALAAAGQIRDAVPGGIADGLTRVHAPADLLNIFDFLGGGVGREQAIEYAGANGADVTAYQYDRFSDRIDVSVRGRATAQGGEHSLSAAAARLGPHLGACRLDTDPGAALTSVGVILRCGDLQVHFTFTGSVPTLDTTPAELRDQFRPRLAG
jgi:Putative Flp pilus-assembly TadE/G-like